MKRVKLTQEIYDFFAACGRRGGKSRAKNLTADRRREIATIAARAAAVVRTRKAQERKNGI